MLAEKQGEHGGRQGGGQETPCRPHGGAAVGGRGAGGAPSHPGPTTRGFRPTTTTTRTWVGVVCVAVSRPPIRARPQRTSNGARDQGGQSAERLAFLSGVNPNAQNLALEKKG